MLEEAAGKIRAAVRDQDGRELSSVPGEAREYGNEELQAALSAFCTRWSETLDELVENGREIADALAASASSYRRADAAAASALDQDPAVEAADG
ncbi:hypothetical protein GCM10025787_36160 [Saccharopolyspora rosea]